LIIDGKNKCLSDSSALFIGHVRGQWAYLYRAVDKKGQTVDFLLSAHRDIAAARQFFTQAIK
jgi:transposase-like protein